MGIFAVVLEGVVPARGSRHSLSAQRSAARLAQARLGRSPAPCDVGAVGTRHTFRLHLPTEGCYCKGGSVQPEVHCSNPKYTAATREYTAATREYTAATRQTCILGLQGRKSGRHAAGRLLSSCALAHTAHLRQAFLRKEGGPVPVRTTRTNTFSNFRQKEFGGLQGPPPQLISVHCSLSENQSC